MLFRSLDLLHGRMTASAEVAVGPNRRLDDDGCIQALRTAYVESRDELKELFKEA